MGTPKKARTFYGVDLDTLQYRKGNGKELVEPAHDLSGIQYELDEKEKAAAAAK